MTTEQFKEGVAGKLAASFINSKLTPLFMVAALLLGVAATLSIPREEEPQISVPMFDVFVSMPGASVKEVEERIIKTGERKLWEIPDVEYIYSTAEPGLAMFIVRFKVGTSPETAMTRVYTKTFANVDLMPPGAPQPFIKPRSIDDVPILALTFSGGHGSLALRRMAAAVRDEVSAIPLVAETNLIGGKKRQFLIHFNPDALRRHHLSPLDLAQIVSASNVRLPAGAVTNAEERLVVDVDSFIHTAEELGQIVVGVSGGLPIQLKDVASVIDGPDESEQSVHMGSVQAVTLAVSKRPGANATQLSNEILERAHRVMDQETKLNASSAIPIKMSVTRNYGRTAEEKSDELLFHVFLATISVTLLVSLVLGFREGIVVLIAVLITLALTLLIFSLFGYTLNRITLFALIFSIGILVDDAIVVVENIHRHATMKKGKNLVQVAIEAVAEVGNPTILATWAVIAAILPMAFVRGLMGPYMRPIPVGASIAMLFSLAVAFVVSPYVFIRLLQIWPKKNAGHDATEGPLDKLYRRLMGRLLSNRATLRLYFVVLIGLLLAALATVPLKLVRVKMLPFDDKNEFEVILNMPESSSYEKTKQVADEIAAALKKISEVKETVTYVGTASPYNFNGLVRHYFLRQRPYQAQVLAMLADRHVRKRQSHAIATEARGPVRDIAERFGARVQVAEVPPGPPVLSPLVFEIYGPDAALRDHLARRLVELLKKTDGVTDVDTYVPTAQPLSRLDVNRVKTSLNGLASAQVAQTVTTAVDGQTLGLAHDSSEREPVEIRLRLPASQRSDLKGAKSIALFTRGGNAVSIGDLTTERRLDQDPPLYRKNLLPVSYVIADLSGRLESPIYALLSLRGKIQSLMEEELKKAGVASSPSFTQYFARLPKDSSEWALKWDGEWHVTYEVFRDLGLAFAAVLILIYVLVVFWFESFLIPLVIMAPIPLTLVGILPAHWGLDAFFTATSMIGFIAGAGIVVRNSIILVDFIQLRLKEGLPLKEAVIDAGAIRFRPMLLTAAAVVVGAGVILFDPIFQGLAVSLMAGEVASTFLSRTAVPVLYYLLAKQQGVK